MTIVYKMFKSLLFIAVLQELARNLRNLSSLVLNYSFDREAIRIAASSQLVGFYETK